MSVVIWSTSMIDSRRIKGDLADLVHDMNIAAAKGHQFVLAEKEDGTPIAFETRNITIMEQEDDNAFIGG